LTTNGEQKHQKKQKKKTKRKTNKKRPNQGPQGIVGGENGEALQVKRENHNLNKNSRTLKNAKNTQKHKSVPVKSHTLEKKKN